MGCVVGCVQKKRGKGRRGGSPTADGSVSHAWTLWEINPIANIHYVFSLAVRQAAPFISIKNQAIHPILKCVSSTTPLAACTPHFPTYIGGPQHRLEVCLLDRDRLVALRLQEAAVLAKIS